MTIMHIRRRHNSATEKKEIGYHETSRVEVRINERRSDVLKRN